MPMKKIILFLFVIFTCLLSAGLNDYEEEFGFPLDKPRHGRYYFLRELLSIDRDPQIMNFTPDENALKNKDIVNQAESTELDKVELSDSTLVLNVAALSDLDLFGTLDLNDSFSEYENINFSASEYSFTLAEPADYNLYSRMQIPPQNKQPEAEIELLDKSAVTDSLFLRVKNKIDNAMHQIDDIFLKTNKIIPQYGSIEYTIIINNEGIHSVQVKTQINSKFSNLFLTESRYTIENWQIYSHIPVEYTFTKNYIYKP